MNDLHKKRLKQNIELMEKNLIEEHRKDPNGCIARFLEEKQESTSTNNVLIASISAAVALALALLAGIGAPEDPSQVESFVVKVLIIATIWIFVTIDILIVYRHNQYRKALVEYKESILKKHGWWK